MKFKINNLSINSLKKLKKYIEFNVLSKQLKEKSIHNLIHKDNLDYDNPNKDSSNIYELDILKNLKEQRKKLLKDFIESLKEDDVG